MEHRSTARRVRRVGTQDAPHAGEIVERADGYYWRSDDGERESGPFESFEHARADRDGIEEEGLAPGALLREAEREIGINDWIDAESGEPAEGSSPPHLGEE